MVTNWAIVIYEWFCVGFCRFSPVAPRERLGLGGRTHARHDFSRCVCETVDAKNLSTLAHTCRDRRLLLGICLFSLTWTCVLSVFKGCVPGISISLFFFFFSFFFSVCANACVHLLSAFSQLTCSLSLIFYERCDIPESCDRDFHLATIQHVRAHNL